MEKFKKLITLLNQARHIYHPHRSIVKSKKETSNIRIVFHGSSKLKNELSINEFVEPGSSLLHLLFAVLLRFQLRSKGIIDDIRQMCFENFTGTHSL